MTGINIVLQTSALLSIGNFKLIRWCLNVPVVLVGVSDKVSFLKFDDGGDFTKTLGLVWDPMPDQLLLLLLFSTLQSISRPSRSSVLSVIAQLYDPLGLFGPVITKLKIFLQLLCTEKLTWNESLPLAQDSEWQDLC